MDSASIGLKQIRHGAKSANRPEGSSLLEMMMVVTVIPIVASTSAPLCMTAMAGGAYVTTVFVGMYAP